MKPRSHAAVARATPGATSAASGRRQAPPRGGGTLADLLLATEAGPLVRRAGLLGTLTAALAETLPAPLARQARAVQYEAGVLSIHVASNAAAAKLRMLAPRLQAALAPRCGPIETLRVEVRPGPAFVRAERRHARLLPSAAAERLGALAAGIDHPGLRQAVESLARKSDRDPAPAAAEAGAVSASKAASSSRRSSE